MKLRFTPRALENLAEIAGYLGARNPVAADRVREAIDESVQKLTAFPLIGRRQTERGVRRLVTRRYRYLVYYLVDEAADEVVILNVKHRAQDRDYSDA